MKKTLSFFLSFVLTLCSITAFPVWDVSADPSGVYTDAYTAICDGLMNFDEEIDLSSFGIHGYIDDGYLESPDYVDLIHDVLYMNPQLFYVDFDNISISYSPSSKTVIGISPVYLMDENGAKEALSFIDGEIQRMLDDHPDLKYMSDIAKCLTVHDVIINNFEYDHDYVIADLYGMILNGKGVCQAYTLLYKYILDGLGVNCAYSKSEAMDHSWNLVQIGSDWYHVDCTWDDPGDSYALGRTSYEYFLKSDAAFINENDKSTHYGVEDDYECNNTAYDNYLWSDLTSPVIFTDSDTLWYVDGNDSVLRKRAGGMENDVFEFEDKWLYYDESGGITTYYYNFCYSGLAYRSGSLYFNGPYDIYRYDTISGKTELIKTVEREDGCICSICLRGDTLYYCVSKSISSVGKVYSLVLESDDPVIYDDITDVIPTDSTVFESDGVKYVRISRDRASSLSLPECALLLAGNGTPLKGDVLITTGMQIALTDGSETVDSAVMVVLGDVVTDGVLDEADYQKARSFVLGGVTLDNAAAFASDFDGNGYTDMEDCISIRLNANK